MGDQGPVLRQLMLSHVIQQKSICLIASPRSKKKQFAVAHDKGKVSGLFRISRHGNRQDNYVFKNIINSILTVKYDCSSSNICCNKIFNNPPSVLIMIYY